MLSSLAQLALSIVVLVYGTTIVTPEIMESWTGFELFLVLPVMVPIVTLSGATLLAYYYLLIAAIIASCTAVVVKGARPFARELMMKGKSREHSVIFATLSLLFATLFFSIVIGLLANPSADELPSTATTAEALFLLANASVWEEIIVRILMIGLPLLVVDYARRRVTKLRSYVLGGGFRLGNPEVLLLVASSVIFGVAHFTSGWGSWKIVPSAAGGLAFGYLFLRYGIAASITMHFATDYLSMPIEISDSVVLAAVTIVGVLVWAAFGLMFFVYYVTRIIEFLSGQKVLEPKPATAVWQGPWGTAPIYPPQPNYGQWHQYQHTAPFESTAPGPPVPAPAHPQPRGSAAGGYVCPRCGGIEARWKDGRFECLRCGHLS
jgi:membrane protease YdiL (CAAX protease family)